MKKIIVSACLLGRNCKYSGGNNRNEAVLSYVKGREVIPVCPEVAAGMPVPRFIDPLGHVLAEAGEGEEICYAEYDEEKYKDLGKKLSVVSGVVYGKK